MLSSLRVWKFPRQSHCPFPTSNIIKSWIKQLETFRCVGSFSMSSPCPPIQHSIARTVTTKKESENTKGIEVACSFTAVEQALTTHTLFVQSRVDSISAKQAIWCTRGNRRVNLSSILLAVMQYLRTGYCIPCEVIYGVQDSKLPTIHDQMPCNGDCHHCQFFTWYRITTTREQPWINTWNSYSRTTPFYAMTNNKVHPHRPNSLPAAMTMPQEKTGWDNESIHS